MPYRGRITEIGASHGSPFGPMPGEAWASFEKGQGGLAYDGGMVADTDDDQGLPLVSAAILGQDVPAFAYQIDENIVGDAPKMPAGPATMPTDPKHYGPGIGGQAPQIASKVSSYIPIATQPAPWAPAPAFTLPLAGGIVEEETPWAPAIYQTLPMGPPVEEEAAAAQAAADAQEAEAKKGQLWIWVGAGVILWLLMRG